jgi:Ca-activated chloride channel family protein
MSLTNRKGSSMRNKLSVVLGVVLASGLLLTGCTTGVDTPNGGNADASSSFENDGCTHITIATSSEKVNLMDEMAAKFKESPEMKGLDKCVSVKPINVTSGDGTRILSAAPSEWPLADEEFWPTLWSPASTVWTDRVAAVGNGGQLADVNSFTRTPVVYGVPESMAKALGYPAKPVSLTDIKNLIANPDGWGSVGKPLWGSFTISKTNPNTSTTGLSAILMQSYAAAGKQDALTVDDVAAASDFSRAFESGAIHYGDTTGKVLTTLYNETQNGATNTGYVSAIALEETSLINYNMGNPDSHTIEPGEKLTPPKEKLVAVYPSEGSLWSDNPVAVLNTAWVSAEKKAAGEAFAEFLQTNPAQTVLPEFGFRPLDAGVDLGDLFTPANGIDPAQPAVTLPLPDAGVVSAAIDQWEDIRKPSAVLELVDISGSMKEPIGDGRSRLDGAISGVQSTVGHFRGGDEVGVWAFTTEIKSELGDNIVPVREFKSLGADKENLQDSVEDLRRANKAGTPLYDAISKSYDYMLERAEPGRINAIVVLTDGDDTDSKTSLESLLVKLNSAKTEGGNSTQVRIFPIAYGEEAKLEALEQIAKASGGQAFDASDASKIDTVFASVINNF